MTIPKPLHLVYVEWDDADSVSRWMDAEEIGKYAAISNPVRQAGFVLQDTDKVLMLAGSYLQADPLKAETYGDLVRIPKPWIHKRLSLLTLNSNGAITRRK